MCGREVLDYADEVVPGDEPRPRLQEISPIVSQDVSDTHGGVGDTHPCPGAEERFHRLPRELNSRGAESGDAGGEARATGRICVTCHTKDPTGKLSDMSSKSVDGSVLEFVFEVKSMIAELNPVLTRTFRELGLTCVQADALMALERLGPVTLKELATHLVAESGHPSRLISRLDADGLVMRETAPEDGRAVLITLTARGAELAAAARVARAPLLAEFAQRFTGGRLDDATALVREVRHLLHGH